MAFNPTELEIIKFGKEQGKTRQQVEQALFNYRNGIIKKPEVLTFGQEAKQDILQTGSNLKNTLDKTVNKVSEIGNMEESGEQNKATGFLKKVGTTLGGISQGIGDVFMGGVKAILPQKAEEGIKKGLVSGIEKALPVLNEIDKMVGSPIGTRIEAYKNLNAKDKATLDSFIGTGMFGADVAGLGLGGKIIAKGAKAGGEAIGQAGKSILNTTENIANIVSKTAPEIGERTTKFLASNPDKQIINLLKEIPTDKFDKAVAIASKASQDIRADSIFESVGKNVTEATKQLQKQVASLGKQKQTIINSAKVGLKEFTEAPRKAILEVMKLPESPIKNQVIDILKKAKTIKGVDKAIDDIQEILSSGKQLQTIATGSKVEKQLNGIIGKLNTALKESPLIPKTYKELNIKLSNRYKALKSLNSSLGEVVDGVSVRGAGLVKQFFSPSGTKAKKLFEYIKKSTGVDLAQDAALAKFLGEVFGDIKVNSMLSGIPMTKAGAIDKAIEFIGEKTGLSEKISETVKKGKLLKARELTK